MALRNASAPIFGLGRLAVPLLNAQASRELHAFVPPSREEQQSNEPTSAHQAVTPLLASLVKSSSSGIAPLLSSQPRRVLLPGLGRTASGALPPAGLGLGLGAASALQLPQPQQQLRAYNAWSPAQRYFVEGDHVIAAEANRTFQFTGLDSGSFYPYVVATAIATAISTVFIVAPLVIAPSRVDLDKSSAYECGFDAFGEARQTFSVSFYLVSIMYLLFDIEIAYLFPYAMTHASLPMYWTMNLFLAILVAGFAYEWGMGALEWRE